VYLVLYWYGIGISSVQDYLITSAHSAPLLLGVLGLDTDTKLQVKHSCESSRIIPPGRMVGQDKSADAFCCEMKCACAFNWVVMHASLTNTCSNHFNHLVKTMHMYHPVTYTYRTTLHASGVVWPNWPSLCYHCWFCSFLVTQR
jgi:hypothetical protein